MAARKMPMPLIMAVDLSCQRSVRGLATAPKRRARARTIGVRPAERAKAVRTIVTTAKANRSSVIKLTEDSQVIRVIAGKASYFSLDSRGFGDAVVEIAAEVVVELRPEPDGQHKVGVGRLHVAGFQPRQAAVEVDL